MIRVTTPHKALNIWDWERCGEVVGQSLGLIVWRLVFLQKNNYVYWFEAVSFNSKNMSMKTL